MEFYRQKRRFDELRPVTITPGFLRHPEGSCLIAVGSTHVLCAASIEERVPAFKRGSGEGWLTAEYSLLPRSTKVRTQREATRGRPSGRTQEIQRLVGRCLRAVTDLKLLGERSILLDCDVLEADGGTRTAAITGAFVALALACRGLVEAGVLHHSPVREQVAAISVGLVSGVPILDLEYEEDSVAEVDMNVAMTSSNRFVEVQGSAEGMPFDDAALQQLLDLARSGIGVLLEAQKRALEGGA